MRLLKRVLVVAGVLVVLLFAAALLRAVYAFRDRIPGYALSISIDGDAPGAPAVPLQAGFGRRRINPDLTDRSRPVWLAGFSQGRAATRLHDDLWAVACVVDDGRTRLAVVGLDAIGMFNDDVVAIRRKLPADWRIGYAIVTSTHNHSTPDLMGLWGPAVYRNGVDRNYLRQVQGAVVDAIGDAVKSLVPASVSLHEMVAGPAGLNTDSRRPLVFDPGLRLMLFRRPESGAVIGSVISWANHPETPWAHNTELTADFCGVLRDSVEKGISYDGEEKVPGVGGIHLYVNGAIGGLMTTHPDTTVRDPFLERDFSKPSHEKSRAVGNILAQKILEAIETAAAAPEAARPVPVSVRARSIDVPIDNKTFVAAQFLGLLDRGNARWMTMRSEIAFVTIGDASIACFPGEVYPEIVNGGIVRPPGGDFDIDPVEVPPIRDLMPGKVKFVFGLANDEIGYIIPRSEWDAEAPYLYLSSRATYGEENSCGPGTAPLLHSSMQSLIRSLETVRRPVTGASGPAQ
jgi:hypothetical protein